MAKKVTRSNTDYDVQLQRRDGKAVAIIEAETVDIYEDGRGYAGRTVVNRQVMVVPLSSLGSLAEQVVRTLTFNATAEDEDRYDLENDAQATVGLYPPRDPSTPVLDPRTPVATFYTVVEARLALAACASGYSIAHLPEEGENLRQVIEVKP